jgi:hypothetical protein
MPHVTHMLDIYSRLFSAVNCHTMGIKRFRLGLYCWRHFLQFSIISWMSVLLVEETRVTEENHRPVASHWQTLSHNVVSSTSGHERNSNSQLKCWWALIVQLVVNPTTIRSQPQLFQKIVEKPKLAVYWWWYLTTDNFIKSENMFTVRIINYLCFYFSVFLDSFYRDNISL